MKHEIFPLVIATFSLFLVDCVYAQDYDLIVTVKGDSIACRIDSINETFIYYEMRSQGAWLHTYINKSSVADYKRNVIQWKQFNFKAGTSIIESQRPDTAITIRDIQKNSVYVGILSLNYARLIPAGDNLGITIGGGLYHFDNTGIVVEASVLKGGVRHFFETGIMGFYFLSSSSEPEEDSANGGVSFRLGYRYQGPGGLLLRAAPNFIFYGKDFFVFPALSIGYSF